jgi:Rrf2 family protein
MLVLRNAGFVEAVRGSSGGYRLNKPAREVHVVDVVDLFEGVHSEPKCLLGEDHECSDKEACSAHARYRRLRLAYMDFLTKTSIESLSKKKMVKKQK